MYKKAITISAIASAAVIAALNAPLYASHKGDCYRYCADEKIPEDYVDSCVRWCKGVRGAGAYHKQALLQQSAGVFQSQIQTKEEKQQAAVKKITAKWKSKSPAGDAEQAEAHVIEAIKDLKTTLKSKGASEEDLSGMLLIVLTAIDHLQKLEEKDIDPNIQAAVKQVVADVEADPRGGNLTTEVAALKAEIEQLKAMQASAPVSGGYISDFKADFKDPSKRITLLQDFNTEDVFEDLSGKQVKAIEAFLKQQILVLLKSKYADLNNTATAQEYNDVINEINNLIAAGGSATTQLSGIESTAQEAEMNIAADSIGESAFQQITAKAKNNTTDPKQLKPEDILIQMAVRLDPNSLQNNMTKMNRQNLIPILELPKATSQENRKAVFYFLYKKVKPAKDSPGDDLLKDVFELMSDSSITKVNLLDSDRKLVLTFFDTNTPIDVTGVITTAKTYTGDFATFSDKPTIVAANKGKNEAPILQLLLFKRKHVIDFIINGNKDWNGSTVRSYIESVYPTASRDHLKAFLYFLTTGQPAIQQDSAPGLKKFLTKLDKTINDRTDDKPPVTAIAKIGEIKLFTDSLANKIGSNYKAAFSGKPITVTAGDGTGDIGRCANPGSDKDLVPLTGKVRYFNEEWRFAPQKPPSTLKLEDFGAPPFGFSGLHISKDALYMEEDVKWKGSAKEQGIGVAKKKVGVNTDGWYSKNLQQIVCLDVAGTTPPATTLAAGKKVKSGQPGKKALSGDDKGKGPIAVVSTSEPAPQPQTKASAAWIAKCNNPDTQPGWKKLADGDYAILKTSADKLYIVIEDYRDPSKSFPEDKDITVGEKVTDKPLRFIGLPVKQEAVDMSDETDLNKIKFKKFGTTKVTEVWHDDKGNVRCATKK